MEREIKLGDRTYIFYNQLDGEVAKLKFYRTNSNESLEDELESEGIDFCYALMGSNKWLKSIFVNFVVYL